MSDLVAIATDLAPQEAEMLRGRLQADGVFAVVAGANVAGNLRVYGLGARVLAPKYQEAEALRIKQECT